MHEWTEEDKNETGWIDSVRFERVGSTFYKFTTISRIKVRSTRLSQSILFVI